MSFIRAIGHSLSGGGQTNSNDGLSNKIWQSGMFFCEFLKQVSRVGAIAPSSVHLSSAVNSIIDFASSKVIVEVGAGTGIFTRKILEKMGSDSILLAFEPNQKFCNELKQTINDPRIIIVNDSVENMPTVLKTKRIGSVDCIVSSMPFLNRSKTTTSRLILLMAKALGPEGMLIVVQYTKALNERLSRIFNKVTVDWVPLNLPPAYLFTCRY